MGKLKKDLVGSILDPSDKAQAGFAIISFAPMPMFASFGLLTAIMILLAFIAALVVLPSLLYLVSRKEEKELMKSPKDEGT